MTSINQYWNNILSYIAPKKPYRVVFTSAGVGDFKGPYKGLSNLVGQEFHKEKHFSSKEEFADYLEQFKDPSTLVKGAYFPVVQKTIDETTVAIGLSLTEKSPYFNYFVNYKG